MPEAFVHENHIHSHGPGCGHTAIRHAGHTDYLHDGCLHHASNGKVEEHTLEITAENPSACTPEHRCVEHEPDHIHGPACGHELVPHGDHMGYLVGGHLHCPHNGHCDDHGPVQVVSE